MMKKRLLFCILGCLLLVFGLSAFVSATMEQSGQVIPYPDNYDLTTTGASSYAGIANHPESKYFRHIDVYNLVSNETLTVLPKFATYQQTTEYTCGPASALMVLYHYENQDWEELQIAEIMQTSQDLDGDNLEAPGEANERGEWGTSTTGMVKFFTEIGWMVTSSLTEANPEDGYTFSEQAEFTEWVIGHLKNNTPIMVEWIDWLGHWQVIIGYDTMGTETLGDDVLIFADPYDTSDHLQDGYYLFNAERFFYMWADAFILPETQMYQQWVIATPQ